MAKTKEYEKARAKRLAEGRKLLKERQKLVKEEQKAETQKQKIRKEAKKSQGKIIDKASKLVGYKQTLSKTLLGYSNAFNPPEQKKVGRPKLIYVHTSPFTGKPVPAPEYYRQLRAYKRIQTQKAEDLKEKQFNQFAQRGIAPSQVQDYQQRLRQLQQLQQIQQSPQQYTNQAPLQRGQVIPAGTRVWKFRRGTVGQEGGLFGPVQKVYGLPQSFWN